ncbi:steroid transmembrane transporter SLC22A24-like [Schistocerca cancellata]|uniref:steroid transmembrane transporter SLC22A24-like n=1 Tax=Schistocerca cancellata TaxID=274614 RepID=UPI002117F754|nr:steroid transmembrane transporter SLC22A24-like [Schistocerca cancellata]
MGGPEVDKVMYRWENNGTLETRPKSSSTPAFEEVLESIGSRGKFQTRLIIVFICVGPCINMMSVNLFYLAMQTPNHWCHVPGRENTSLSLEEWKNITIPREGPSFSKCLMYNESDVLHLSNRTESVKCQYGWEYDKTWFTRTAPSQMNWVCDNQQAINDILFYSQNIGVALGLLFGYIGDMYGRRPQQFLCLVAHVASRLLIVLAPDVLVLFILAESLVSAVAGPLLESALAVGLELTDVRYRTTVNRYASCSMATGMMATGLVAWVMPDWTYCLSFATGSCLALLLFFSWFPESPRWLACRGRQQETMRLLRRIAATNGTTVPPLAFAVVRTLGKSKTDRRGFLSLFSSRNVFKNSVLLIIARSVYLLTMFSPVLAVSSLSVNPFLTVAAQGGAQFVSYCVANFCASRIGRRWSGVAAPLLAAIASGVIFCMLTVDIAGPALVAMIMVMQFSTTISFSVANLQSVEVHPTCLRQIAACVEWAIAGVAMSALPYLALMVIGIKLKNCGTEIGNML